MKRNGLGEHREWEDSEKVYVFGTEGIDRNDIESTRRTAGDVIHEFNLPLEVFNGNTTKIEDVQVVSSLITKNTQGNLIDFSAAVRELYGHYSDGLLRYGIIVLVDPKKFKFKTPPGKEPAIFGLATPEGLVVLLKFQIKNAVRHEFGHMIGLGGHHKGCVMEYRCTIERFCEVCQKKIKEIWEL